MSRLTIDDLFDAVKTGNTDRTGEILDQQPDLLHKHRREWDEMMPLHVAVIERDGPMVRLLMEQGAKPDQGIYPHRAAKTPRVMAEDREFDDIVAIIEEIMAARKAEPPKKEPPPEESDLQAAIARGDVATVGNIIEAGHPDLVPDVNKRHRLLTKAVRGRHTIILKMLLDAGCDPDERIRLYEYDNEVYSWGDPLCTAAGTGQADAARMLLDAGADPNASLYASGNPLSWAYNAKHQEIIDLLYKRGAEMEPWLAGSEGDLDKIREILAEQPELASVPGHSNLLWNAICGGEPDCVAEILKHWKEPPPPGSLGEAMRIWRCQSHRVHPEFDRSKYQTIFRMLLDKGVDPNQELRQGFDMMHQVVEERVHAITEDEQMAFAGMLLEFGGKLDRIDHLLQSTPLGWAARWGYPKIVRLYLDHGADPALAGAEWALPVRWAEKRGHAEIVQMLS